MQELLYFMGLEGRVHLEWISSAEAQKFAQVVTDFTEKIRSMGPNPLAMLSNKSESGRCQADWRLAASRFRRAVKPQA